MFGQKFDEVCTGTGGGQAAGSQAVGLPLLYLAMVVTDTGTAVAHC